MILSGHSKRQSASVTDSNQRFSGRFAAGDPCPRCAQEQPPEKVGELVSRPAYPYPVLVQVLFGISFIVFLCVADKISAHRAWIWTWSAVQVGLGVLLMLLRRRSSRRILHCIRCGLHLR